MDHHRHVDIVEMALGDEFGLAEQELDFSAFAPPEALLDIDEFLGRDREKHDFAGEVLGRARCRQSHRDPEHPGDLGIMAAAMRRAGMWIGERVLGGTQAVQFAEQREPRAGLAAAQAPLDPGQPEAGFGREAQFSHRLRDERSGPGLVEAGFGMVQDSLAELDDGVPLAVDRVADHALQFVPGQPAPGDPVRTRHESLLDAGKCRMRRGDRGAPRSARSRKPGRTELTGFFRRAARSSRRIRRREDWR